MRLNMPMTLTLGSRASGGDPTPFHTLLTSLGCASWYDPKNIVTGAEQSLPNRMNNSADPMLLGATSGAEGSDPLALPHSGSNYVRFPGTTGNNLSVPRPFATTHVTVTKVDDTTQTFTSTADPVLVGGTTVSGLVKQIVMRETDGAGTIGVSIVGADMTGQQSFTASTAQTVTVNRSAAGPKTEVVTRPVILPDGAATYGTLPASDTPTFSEATGKHTTLVVHRYFPDNSGSAMFSTESESGNGVRIRSGSSVIGQVYIGPSTGTRKTLTLSSVPAPGTITVVGYTADLGAVRGYDDIGGMTASQTLPAGAITHTAPRLAVVAYSVLALSNRPVLGIFDFPGVALTESEANEVAAFAKAGAYA